MTAPQNLSIAKIVALLTVPQREMFALSARTYYGNPWLLVPDEARLGGSKDRMFDAMVKRGWFDATTARPTEVGLEIRSRLHPQAPRRAPIAARFFYDEPLTIVQTITALARSIHASNVRAGWWSDITVKPTWWQQILGITPDTSILHSRNRGELMMLIVSEISEASHGMMYDAADDKLPHRQMFDVELADTAIRLLDLIGAEMSLHGDGISRMISAPLPWNVDGLELMHLVNGVSRAMEHHRKGRINEYVNEICATLAGVITFAEWHGVPLFEIIDEKTAFNRVRPDHQIANRRKPGGKAY